MEKLLELLNEFEKERKSWFTWRSIDSYDNCVYWVDCDWETEITMYSDLYYLIKVMKKKEIWTIIMVSVLLLSIISVLFLFYIS